MADSDCTSGNLALIPCHHKKQHLDTSFGFNRLCDELVEEILLRLPTKSAFQFKVVCKKWYSLLSSPSFVSRFISRFIHIHHHRDRDKVVQSGIISQYSYLCDCKSGYSSNCKQHPYHFQIMSDCSLLSNLYGKDVFQLTYLPCPPNDLRLVGSFADLILCSYLNPTTNQITYYVSNLLTKQWIVLPPAPALEGHVRSVSIGFICFPPSCKPVDNSAQYKFMVVKLCSDYSYNRSQFKVQVFSSEDCKWKTLRVSSSTPLEPYGLDAPLVAYRGKLHWLNLADYIVVYDPINDPTTFSRIINLPIELPFIVQIDSWFGVSQDCLRVVKIANSSSIMDVWELEDYDSGLWKLVYKVDLRNLYHNGLWECDPRLFSILSIHPENGHVIFLRIKNVAVLLNMKSRILETFYPIKQKARFNWLSVFHLSDQWCPTAVSSLHKT